MTHDLTSFSRGRARNPPGVRDIQAEPPEDKLWVDRYRPQRFLDLLGDEVRELRGINSFHAKYNG